MNKLLSTLLGTVIVAFALNATAAESVTEQANKSDGSPTDMTGAKSTKMKHKKMKHHRKHKRAKKVDTTTTPAQ